MQSALLSPSYLLAPFRFSYPSLAPFQLHLPTLRTISPPHLPTLRTISLPAESPCSHGPCQKLLPPAPAQKRRTNTAAAGPTRAIFVAPPVSAPFAPTSFCGDPDPESSAPNILKSAPAAQPAAGLVVGSLGRSGWRAGAGLCAERRGVARRGEVWRGEAGCDEKT